MNITVLFQYLREIFFLKRRRPHQFLAGKLLRDPSTININLWLFKLIQFYCIDSNTLKKNIIVKNSAALGLLSLRLNFLTNHQNNEIQFS